MILRLYINITGVKFFLEPSQFCRDSNVIDNGRCLEGPAGWRLVNHDQKHQKNGHFSSNFVHYKRINGADLTLVEKTLEITDKKVRSHEKNYEFYK